MVASAETNLPRGETYLAPPDAAVAAPTPAAVAALPQKPAPQKPTPIDEPQIAPVVEALDPAGTDTGRIALDDAPLPPRRPQEFAALETPMPPPRPAEYARLPDVITHGAYSVLRGAADVEPLAYAAPLGKPHAELARVEIASTSPESSLIKPSGCAPPPSARQSRRALQRPLSGKWRGRVSIAPRLRAWSLRFGTPAPVRRSPAPSPRHCAPRPSSTYSPPVLHGPDNRPVSEVRRPR
jgi:hypothetical protein